MLAQLLVDPLVEAERGERMALGHVREGDQPEAIRVLLDELEVETGGDVGRAGQVEEILDRPVRPVAVSGAARVAHPAVIDQQRVAGVGEPGGYLIDEGDRTVREHGLLSDSESEIVAGGWVLELFDESIAVETDHHLLRPRGGATQTAERKVVHELVRQDQLRGALHALGDLDPFGFVEHPAGSRARLDGRVLHIEISKALDELSSEAPVARPDLRQ